MRAIIVGHQGQDGTLLRENLEGRGYTVLGFGRTSVYTSDGWRPGMRPNLADACSLHTLMREFRPDEVYYLAAYHTSSQGNHAEPLDQAFLCAQETHVTGLLNVLCAIQAEAPRARLFYASSSLVFSGEHGPVQDETTPLTPQGFYGITKAQGGWLCREFREKHGVFASVGILYNHESPLRAPQFLSQKIVQAAVRIAAGSDEKLVLGNLSAKVDWGFAPDFVEAFRLVLAATEPTDFIVATGQAHTVEELVATAFGHLGLDWRPHVQENSQILTRRQPEKIGNPSKLERLTGWRRCVSFEEMIRKMVEAAQTSLRQKQSSSLGA